MAVFSVNTKKHTAVCWDSSFSRQSRLAYIQSSSLISSQSFPNCFYRHRHSPLMILIQLSSIRCLCIRRDARSKAQMKQGYPKITPLQIDLQSFCNRQPWFFITSIWLLLCANLFIRHHVNLLLLIGWQGSLRQLTVWCWHMSLVPFRRCALPFTVSSCGRVLHHLPGLSSRCGKNKIHQLSTRTVPKCTQLCNDHAHQGRTNGFFQRVGYDLLRL